MEELEKSIRVNKLIDFYGDLLTSHQKEILSLYYQMDLSLSEISEQLDISRNGVYDALKKGVNEEKWNLVTGKKEDIYYIARKSYLAVKTGDPSQMYDMVHTENFILVDKKRRVRGFYDGTKMEDMEKLIEDIKILRDKN